MFSALESGLSKAVIQPLADYYRVPEGVLGHIVGSKPSGETGFFRFGPEVICYGQSTSGVATKIENAGLYDGRKTTQINGADIHLPFDPTQVVDGLRQEHYVQNLMPDREKSVARRWMFEAYYFFREILPLSLRRRMQQVYFSGWKRKSFPAWPVDCTVDNLHHEILELSMAASGLKRVPFIWFWPDGAASCLIMTHDVETSAGRDFTPQLMDLDDSYGFKASFQVIPEERYQVSDDFVEEIRNRGFEFNIHDLNHDGRLYRQREDFLFRAKRINQYAHRYHAQGFRAGSMYRRPDWYDAYEFSYDMSFSTVAHLDPQPGGCGTVFPFFIGNVLELPVTTAQDYSVFHILNEYSIDLWKKQIDLILERNGLISFITHPDYLIDRRARTVYQILLDYLHQLIRREKIWAALPGEVDHWWRARSQMKLLRNGSGWEVRGPEAGSARIAFAIVKDDRLVYEIGTITDRKYACDPVVP
jgi:hypothetical protein